VIVVSRFRSLCVMQSSANDFTILVVWPSSLSQKQHKTIWHAASSWNWRNLPAHFISVPAATWMKTRQIPPYTSSNAGGALWHGMRSVCPRTYLLNHRNVLEWYRQFVLWANASRM
jgi:hypothetical protein